MAPYRLSMPVWCMSCSTSEANGTETCDRGLQSKSAADTSKSAPKSQNTGRQ